jgi:prolyl-tRNA editing enzyme YbaK/EbsC (Cys-tRNA(Pro) deacylase)
MLPAARILEERRVPFRLIELADRALTVEDVVRFSKGDVTPEEICKTVILKNREGGRFALFLRGSDRIDFRKAEKLIGCKLRIGDASDVREAAGVEPGAVCPLLLTIPVIVDERVLRLERINFGSGDHHHGIEMRTGDLLSLIKHSIADITEN